MTNDDTPAIRKIRLTIGDLTAVGIIVAGMLFLLYETFQMTPPVLEGYPGDSFFPRLIIIVILLFGALILINRTRDHIKGRDKSGGDEVSETYSFDLRGFLIIGAISLSFPVLLPFLGFEIVTFVILTILYATRFEEYITAEVVTKTIVRRVVVKASIIAFITMIILYFIFVAVLGVGIPVNFFPKYISF